MAAERIINVQDAFLNYLRKSKISVTVFLLNGVKLNGVISCFDQNTIVIKKDGYIQLIYKHAISTFYPHGAINIFDWTSQQDTDVVQRKVNDEEDEFEAVEYKYEEYI
jgi:host factor-I protein